MCVWGWVCECVKSTISQWWLLKQLQSCFLCLVTIREVGFNDTRCDSGDDLCYYDPLLLTCTFTDSHDSGIQIIIPNYDGLVLYSNNTLIETESSLPPLISVQSYRAFSYSSSTDYIIELFIEQAIVRRNILYRTTDI